jgi:hypothetical protein
VGNHKGGTKAPDQKLTERIAPKSNVCGGRPCIRNTRKVYIQVWKNQIVAQREALQGLNVLKFGNAMKRPAE